MRELVERRPAGWQNRGPRPPAPPRKATAHAFQLVRALVCVPVCLCATCVRVRVPVCACVCAPVCMHVACVRVLCCMCACVSARVCLHVYICACLCMHVCLHVCTCVCMCAPCVCVCACVWVCVLRGCVRVCVLCLCVWVCVHMRICVCPCLHVCVSVCVRVCACACTCLCVSVSAHVRVGQQGLPFPGSSSQTRSGTQSHTSEPLCRDPAFGSKFLAPKPAHDSWSLTLNSIFISEGIKNPPVDKTTTYRLKSSKPPDFFNPNNVWRVT